MVEVSLIIAAVLFVIIALVMYKLIKGIIKTVIVLGAAISIGIAVASFLVIMDANDLQEKFSEEPNLFLLVENSTVISAIEFEGDNEPIIIDQQQVDEFSTNLLEENYDALRSDYYKVIIIDKKILEDNSIEGLDPDLSEKLDEAKYIEDKADLALPILNKTFSDPVFLMIQYKKGNVKVHEETALFKAIELIPTAMIRTVGNAVIDKAKGVVE